MTMSDVLEARRNAILSAIEILRSKKIVSMEVPWNSLSVFAERLYVIITPR